jgi:hypothetical protein
MIIAVVFSVLVGGCALSAMVIGALRLLDLS